MDDKEYWNEVGPLFTRIERITVLYLNDFEKRMKTRRSYVNSMELLNVVERIRRATKDIVYRIIRFSECHRR